MLSFLEERRLSYIVVARLISSLKQKAAPVKQWWALDEDDAVGESELQRRGVGSAPGDSLVVRERLRERKPSPGRRLLEVPGYTFRVFVTNCPDLPEQV